MHDTTGVQINKIEHEYIFQGISLFQNHT